MGEDGPTDFLTILVPRGDYAIEDVWDVVGLRGTGSNDIVIEKAFVPAHRTLSFKDVSALTCPGQAENTAPLYKLPFGTVFAYTITTPIIGIATGAYEAHVERMRERVRISYGQKVSSDPFAHVRVARAATDIDASWLQLERNLDEEMRYANAGEEIPMELRLRARRDQVRATERCIEAIALLFKNSGGHSLKNGNPIERAWRDGNAGSVHAANDTERWLSMEQVSDRVSALIAELGDDAQVGFHGHENLGLGVGNSIVAARAGAKQIDGSTRRFGAGAGNTPVEAFVAAAEKIGIRTGIDTIAIINAAEDVVRPAMDDECQLDRLAILMGYAGVYSSFLKHAGNAAERYGVSGAQILLEAGNRKLIGGQEDQLIDIALMLKAKQDADAGANA